MGCAHSLRLDLRHEPIYRATVMSREALCEEVIGRVVLLHGRHTAGGRLVPGADGNSRSVDPACRPRLTDAMGAAWTIGRAPPTSRDRYEQVIGRAYPGGYWGSG